MRKLSPIILVIAALTVQVSRADDTCLDVLNACDRAYTAQKLIIADQDTQIDNYNKQSELQKKIIQDQQNKLDSPLRDPIKVSAVVVVSIITIELITGVFKR